MAKKQDKKDKAENAPEEVDESPEEESPEQDPDLDGPKAKVDSALYEKIKAQARQEVLHEIQRGALSVPKQVYKKGAVSAIEPVFASKSKGLTAAENDLPKGDNDLVEIQIDEPLYINGKELFGKTIVKIHEARSIAHMIQQKKQADLESTIGRSFLAKKLANGKLDLREVQDLDEELAKHVGKK